MTAAPIQLWLQARGADHAHCPNDCESPQPFLDGARALCGRCWFEAGTETEVRPCAPSVCEGWGG